MNDEQLQRVMFEQAKRLNALGFDWPTLHYYDASNDGKLISLDRLREEENHNAAKDDRYLAKCYRGMFRQAFAAPTVALALKWLRDVKHLRLFDEETEKSRIKAWVEWDDEHKGWRFNIRCFGPSILFKSYEAAESALLDAVLSEAEKQKGGE